MLELLGGTLRQPLAGLLLGFSTLLLGCSSTAELARLREARDREDTRLAEIKQRIRARTTGAASTQSSTKPSVVVVEPQDAHPPGRISAPPTVESLNQDQQQHLSLLLRRVESGTLSRKEALEGLGPSEHATLSRLLSVLEAEKSYAVSRSNSVSSRRTRSSRSWQSSRRLHRSQSAGESSVSTGGRVHVRGYYRKDGTYVRPHTRSRPRR